MTRFSVIKLSVLPWGCDPVDIIDTDSDGTFWKIGVGDFTVMFSTNLLGD